MIPTTPSIIPQPFANAGQRNVIEDSSTVAGAPNATWAQGFPPITMMNKQAGGKPPLGKDMNGVLNALSQHAFFQQSGSVYPWNNELNYLSGSHVMGSDGHEYQAVQPSGPDIPSGSGYVGAHDPVNDTAGTYWVIADATNKANIDLGNVNSTGQAAMAHAAMSSGQYIDLTLPADGGIVTAPADGIIFFRKVASAAGQLITLQKIASENNMILEALNTSGGSYQLAVFLPVSKGDTIRIYYTAAGVTSYFRFIYANGSAPQP